jgi:hypothetical protein
LRGDNFGSLASSEKNKLWTHTTIKDALLILDCDLVVSELHILWPLPGDLWFDAVVEAMKAAGIEYPGQHFVSSDNNGVLQFSSAVDLDLALRLLEVVDGVAARYRELSRARLSVVCCMCFKLVMDHCFFKFFTDY